MANLRTTASTCAWIQSGAPRHWYQLPSAQPRSRGHSSDSTTHPRGSATLFQRAASSPACSPSPCSTTSSGRGPRQRGTSSVHPLHGARTPVAASLDPTPHTPAISAATTVDRWSMVRSTASNVPLASESHLGPPRTEPAVALASQLEHMDGFRCPREIEDRRVGRDERGAEPARGCDDDAVGGIGVVPWELDGVDRDRRLEGRDDGR